MRLLVLKTPITLVNAHNQPLRSSTKDVSIDSFLSHWEKTTHNFFFQGPAKCLKRDMDVVVGGRGGCFESNPPKPPNPKKDTWHYWEHFLSNVIGLFSIGASICALHEVDWSLVCITKKIIFYIFYINCPPPLFSVPNMQGFLWADIQHHYSNRADLIIDETSGNVQYYHNLSASQLIHFS